MSSTNRAKSKERHKSDYYVTPIYAISNFLNMFNQHEKNILRKSIRILDCCAGGCCNSNDKMSYPTVLCKEFNQLIDTIDIRENSLAQIKKNYLEVDCKNKYDMIITNPPFITSREIIEKALTDVTENGYVIMLLKLNDFGSKKRQKFWDVYKPKSNYIHNKRMSFTDNGKTDSVEYMHIVWQKGYIHPGYIKTYLLKEF